MLLRFAWIVILIGFTLGFSGALMWSERKKDTGFVVMWVGVFFLGWAEYGLGIAATGLLVCGCIAIGASWFLDGRHG